MKKMTAPNYHSVDFTRFHYLEPDYRRPRYHVPEPIRKRIEQKVKDLYGAEKGKGCVREIIRIMQVYYAHKTPLMIEWEKEFNPTERFTEKDVILISYGDLIYEAGHKPLETDLELSQKYLRGVFNTIHILPFFPYSSDRGFAIMDYEEVDPRLGSWEDILHLKQYFKLMFDGVINHVSSKSRWFQEFLNQNPDFLDFFTVFTTKKALPPEALRQLVRPRTTPVLTPFYTLYGKRWVWTTFSPDQIDLNFKNPKVLQKIIEILLTYVRRGADIIRLDAVTYLWDEPGTSGAHLRQTHLIIKLIRDVLDAVAPHVALLTETNVPHEENIRYFGDGRDEAQMVYNFALPPLVLHTFWTGNAEKLSHWAANLERVSDTATYLNFLDSHDGIGLLGASHILTAEEIEMLCLKTLEHGGYISYRANPDGSESPYELNITWYSAINREDAEEPQDLQIRRYLASRAIALVMMGVPGIYLHGLLGSRNDAEAVIEQKETRSINRKVISKAELVRALENPATTTFQVSSRLLRLIRLRIRERAFHPNAGQKVLFLRPEVFALLRTSTDDRERILTLTNVTDRPQQVTIACAQSGLPDQPYLDLIAKQTVAPVNGRMSISLEPYQILWLKNPPVKGNSQGVST